MNQLALNFSAARRVYFQTTRLPPEELAKAIAAAADQTERVLAVFRARVALTPSQVHGYLSGNAPITSVRRAITVLTDAGALVKTPAQLRGPWGAMEHVWQLAA